MRLEEKETMLNKKTKQIQDMAEEKGTQAGEIHDLKDMLDVKERKVNVLQKKVSAGRGSVFIWHTSCIRTTELHINVVKKSSISLFIFLWSVLGTVTVVGKFLKLPCIFRF